MHIVLFISYLSSALLAYILGSIPFGLILTRLAGLGDIRHIGSGNIGATNVLRTGKKGIAVATLILDGLKGAVAVLVVHHFYPQAEQMAALSAVLGHIFPIWLNFKGGKGVVTTVGVTTALAWPLGLTCMLIWVVVFKLSRISSVAGLTAIGLLPLVAYMLGHQNLLILLFALVFLVFSKHKENIKRLLKGTESKVGSQKDTV
jgi:acyl phosphate:glycerol-3-phosphate acyltransferase